MTEGKRKIEGIILYKDKMKTALDTLDDEQLGCLLRAFLDWAWNGTEPQFSDLGLRYAFNDWKTKAKEDFAKYDRVVDRNRANGMLGGRPKKEETQENPKNPMGYLETQENPKNPNNNNNNNNNININNINNINKKESLKEKKAADKSATKKSLEERKKDFYESLVPYIDKYDRQMIRDFYDYWSQVNEGGKKMLWEMQKAFEISKRLATWSSRRKVSSQTQEESLYRNAPHDKWEQAKKEKWI